MTRVNAHADRQEKLDTILSKATELFAEKGYRQAGVQQIIDRLGLSKGGFYWHFASKEDLYCRVCQNHCERCRSAFMDILGRELIDLPMIQKAARDLLDWFISNPREIRLMLDFYHESQSESVHRELLKLGQEWERVLTALILRCQQERLISPSGEPGVLARICLIFFRGLLFDFGIGGDREAAMRNWEFFLLSLLGNERHGARS
jgi:AcrR family transcriptional regulator